MTRPEHMARQFRRLWLDGNFNAAWYFYELYMAYVGKLTTFQNQKSL